MDNLFSSDDDDELCAISEENIASLNCDLPSNEHRDILEKNFGHTEFRPLQWKIISSIINERRDVCAVIATGYGKSLCYQYPAVYTNGIVLVVSPLISLMEDQVLALTMSNIPACFLGSAQTKKITVMNDILEGKYKVVYATPEYLTGEKGLEDLGYILDRNQITLLAIDEAHCVSQWGHEFRPKYRQLFKVRDILQNVPILAVTATATPKVQADIVKSLRLRNPLAISSSLDRPNLFFEVKSRSGDEAYLDILRCLSDRIEQKIDSSTIIYCITQKSTEAVHTSLKFHGIKCEKYHAGMTISARRKAHEEFIKDRVKCIVATIAFGMGIDKPDVRNIIHYGSAKDIEGYYQEVGRAGRDGLSAKCTILYTPGDFNLHSFLRKEHGSETYKKHLEEKSYVMEEFINTTECRRKFILRYFDDKICQWQTLKPKKNCCDNCLKTLRAPAIVHQYEGIDENGMYNLVEDVKLLLSTISSLNGRYGMEKYYKMLIGSNTAPPYFKEKPLFGKGKHKTTEWWKIVGRILKSEGYLTKKSCSEAKYIQTVELSAKGLKYMNKPKLDYKIRPPADMMKILKKKIISTTTNRAEPNTSNQKSWITTQATTSTLQVHADKDEESPEEKLYRMDLYKILMDIRNELAHNYDCSPYMVASNIALMNMSKMRPKSLEELKSYNFDAMNEGKLKKFGPKFVDVIKKYCVNKPNNFKITPSQCTQSNTTGINSLKQFAFIENKINIPKTEDVNTDWSDEDDTINDDALNNFYDNLDDSLNESQNIKKNDDCDATLSDLNEKLERKSVKSEDTNDFLSNIEDLNIKSQEQNKNETSDDDVGDLFEDDWLDSPKSSKSEDLNNQSNTKTFNKTDTENQEKDKNKRAINENWYANPNKKFHSC